MVAFNELSSSPGGAMHDIALADAHDIRAAAEGCADQTHALSDDLILTTPRPPRRNGIERILRAVLKPLVAVMTAQYVIVTALAAFAALVVASEAGKAINAKLEPIIAALKRL